ncbi:anti-sigma factor antagonist [Streptomyces sp. NPDC007904]|jgi:stage II sporulation protein AA (anti-sigma F factor antagonist)|uniref:STAS domain-containing protein n=1 Tax=Streptomyces sp. NPDC007904 TaxID=3364787 RepID=UPI0036ECA766
MSEEPAMNAEKAQQPPRLTVVATATDGIRVLTAAGEIDHDTVGPLRQALDVPGLPRPRIVIDMRRVTFMDSTGINTLLLAHRAVTAADGWLRLAAPADNVVRLLRIVGVDSVIDCHDTLRQALTP